MAEFKKMTVQIGGAKYPITTPENEEYVSDLAREIDRSARQLMDGSHISLNEALVLLCLSYADCYRKSEETADHLRGQIAEYLEEAARARTEVGEAKKELARLEARLREKDKSR